MTIPTKTLPATLKKHTRGYRKHQIGIYGMGDTYSRRATFWDGGSQTSYTPLLLVGGEVVETKWPEGSAPGGFTEGFRSGAEFPVPEGFIVMSSGTFRGKTAMVSFSMSDDTRQKLGIVTED